MSKRKKILALGIIASALAGFSAKTVNTATPENPLIENEAQAYVASEWPSAATCCPKLGGICIVGDFQWSGYQSYSGGGPCQ